MAIVITLEDDAETVRSVRFRGKTSRGRNQAAIPDGTTRKFGIKHPKGAGEGDCVYDYATGILYCE